ncbi:MAG: hypothetical protein ACLTEE_01935 [Anaerobutyricum hallii]
MIQYWNEYPEILQKMFQKAFSRWRKTKRTGTDRGGLEAASCKNGDGL